jgi:hypothetical protein
MNSHRLDALATLWRKAHALRYRLGGVPFVIASALGVSFAVGCSEPSDHPSSVNTLRVLAVRSETPFTKPGTSADLSMLAFDGSPRARRADGTRRATSTLWMSGCINPPGDAYAGCMPYLHSVVDQFDTDRLPDGTVPANAPPGAIGWGSSIAVSMPGDVSASRPVAPGVAHPYGLQMVFFAYCGGILVRLDTDVTRFPLGCVDADTGAPLGRDDFDFGFYPLFSYETVDNLNPVLNAARFDGVDAAAPVACSKDVPCATGYHCGSQNVCIPVVMRCTQAKVDDCESHPFAVDVARSSVEPAVVAHLPDADAPPETLWVSYYASAGSFERDARVINDPHTGWNDDTAGKWRADTDVSQEVQLWAVVRDNRDGVTWTERAVWVE